MRKRHDCKIVSRDYYKEMRRMKLGILDGPNKTHQVEYFSTLLYCVTKGLTSRDDFVNKAKR